MKLKWRKAAKIVGPIAAGVGLTAALNAPVDTISVLGVRATGLGETPVPYSVAELIHKKLGRRTDTLSLMQIGRLGERLDFEPVSTDKGLHWLVSLGVMLDARGDSVARFYVIPDGKSVGREIVLPVAKGYGQKLVVSRVKDILLRKLRLTYPEEYRGRIDPKIFEEMRGNLKKVVAKAVRENALGIQKSLERQRPFYNRPDNQSRLKKPPGQPDLAARRIFPLARGKIGARHA